MSRGGFFGWKIQNQPSRAAISTLRAEGVAALSYFGPWFRMVTYLAGVFYAMGGVWLPAQLGLGNAQIATVAFSPQ